MSSLDRLIDLAKRTGDRLIVHDPLEGRDVVIMDVDEYENLVIEKENIHQDVRGMSSRQMLDQINRDIAIWRTNKEMEEQWEREEMFEDEMEEGGSFDPFAETDFHVPEWHSAGSVLDRKIQDSRFKINDFDDNVETQNFASVAGMEDNVETQNFASVPEIIEDPFVYPWEKKENVDDVLPVPENKNEGEYFNDGGNLLKEEKLKDDDEPVFYEEPV